jgi:hypothetical protein
MKDSMRRKDTVVLAAMLNLYCILFKARRPV